MYPSSRIHETSIYRGSHVDRCPVITLYRRIASSMEPISRRVCASSSWARISSGASAAFTTKFGQFQFKIHGIYTVDCFLVQEWCSRISFSSWKSLSAHLYWYASVYRGRPSESNIGSRRAPRVTTDMAGFAHTPQGTHYPYGGV